MTGLKTLVGALPAGAILLAVACAPAQQAGDPADQDEPLNIENAPADQAGDPAALDEPLNIENEANADGGTAANAAGQAGDPDDIDEPVNLQGPRASDAPGNRSDR